MRLIIFSLSILFIVLAQTSFIASLNYPLNNLNIVLVIAFFLAILINYKKSLLFSFIAALWLELYSFSFFGHFFFSLLLTLVIINILLNNFFTHRSLYSLLILSFLGSFIYHLIYLSLGFLSFFLKINHLQPLINSQYFYSFFWQTVLNIFLLTIIFLIYNRLSRKLKSVFLIAKPLK